MANIVNVDYEAIPRQALSMRTHGKELNDELVTVYQSIQDMHNVWYGERYNALLAEFNKIVTNLNELLSLVVDEIPFTLETVANNYSLADRGTNAVQAIREEPKKIVALAIPKDVGMKFITNEVSAIKESVSKNFQNSRNKMDTIETEYNKIAWQSEAADAFKAKFKKLKNEIVSSFEQLNLQFTNLMNKTMEDIQRTENANTVQ